jgi:hypothetical protein
VASLSGRSLIACGLATFLLTLLVSFLGASPQQQPPPPPPTAAPVVRGNVLPPPETIDPPEPRPGEGIDFTVKVIDAVTGKGLGDVKLELTRNPSPADRRRWIYTRNTDALGNATVTNMTANNYAIVATLPGYMLSKTAVQNLSLSVGTKPAPLTFRMWRSSSVDGVVQDRDGNPVVGAAVDILEEQWIGGLRTLAVSQPPVMTDPAGKFAFPAVMPGTYYLRATPVRGMVQQQLRGSPAGKQEAFVDTLYPGVLYTEQAAPVKFDPGVNLYNMRIEMQKSPYYSFSGRVSGIPPEIRGSGLVLIRRAAFDSPFPFTWANPYAGNLSVQITADGTFSAPSVPPGPYWAGYTPAGPVRGGTQFLVADRNLEDVRVEVNPGITITGKIVFEDGSVPDVRSGSMSVFQPNLGVYVRGFAVMPNGDFNIGGLPAGPYRVEFSSPVVVRKVEINKRVFNGGEFELTPLDPTAVITLGRAGAAVQGTVDLLDQAKSYPRGMVTIAPQPLRPTDTPKRKYLEGGTTFVVDHLEAGRYRICAWLEEGSDVDRFLGNPQFEQKFGVSCETVNLAADERRAVQLRQITAADFK